MTVDRLPERARASSSTDRDRDDLSPATILSMCDRLLGEVGRRSHVFGWLRAPAAGDEVRWLAVDAYYPRSRLVVMCRPPGPHDSLYRERIPARGLGLLTLDPVALGSDPEAIEAALARRLSDLEHVPRPPSRPREPSRSGRNFSMEPVSSQAPDPSAAAWSRVSVERAPVAPVVQHGLGLVVGLALAAALIAEIYLAVVVVALDAARPLLGLAIALEACSRGLGTVAAERAGDRGWACGCAVGGSPVVGWFALTRGEDRAEAEPAPLAGLLALVAGVVALVALLIGS
jgi:hypothetical protein